MLDGEEEAFREFFDASFAGLYRFAMVRLGYDEDAAEEVTQSTLCAAIDSLHGYRGESALFTWMCTICRRQISTLLERQGRRAPVVALLEDSPEVRSALDALAATAELPDGELLRREVGDLVRIALDNLPQRYSWALEWKYLEGASVREIAERLEVSPKAAESVLTRARDAFREAFATLCAGLGEPSRLGLAGR